jgi:RNA polymerase sigma factor (sigma-70 family)
MNNTNYPNDINLINKIKDSNDEESLKLLIKRHEPMCFSIYKKYSNLISSSGASIEDLAADKGLIVYKSALSFNDEKKSKFSTWLYNQIRYQCLNYINQNKNTIPMENDKINYLIEQNSKLNNDKNPEEIKNINEYIFKILDSSSDPRISKVYHLRYFSGSKLTPWSKIAKDMGLSTQTVINLHKKGANLLKIKLNSKIFLERV